MNAWAATTCVWDKAGEIEFVKPGRGTVHADFRLDDAVLDELRAATASGDKDLRWFETDVDRCARRRRRARAQAALRAPQARRTATTPTATERTADNRPTQHRAVLRSKTDAGASSTAEPIDRAITSAGLLTGDRRGRLGPLIHARMLLLRHRGPRCTVLQARQRRHIAIAGDRRLSPAAGDQPRRHVHRVPGATSIRSRAKSRSR